MGKVKLTATELRAELARGLEGEKYESAEVRNGVVTVTFSEAPGCPAGWSVDFTSTNKGVEARYRHSDGRSATARRQAQRGRLRLPYPEAFAGWPSHYSETMWRGLVSRHPGLA